MKYVLIFALFVAVAQVDTLMKLFNKAKDEVDRQRTKISAPADTTTIQSESSIIAVDEDITLKIDPHTRVISLMESYRLSPEPAIREKIMEDIKLVPKMLTGTLDRDLEVVLYSWRDLLLNQNQDAILFFISLENLLQGENQIVVRKLFSSLFDRNLEAFIKIYSKTRDVNCKGATYFADPVPMDEKLNELQERDDELSVYLKKENLEAPLKNFATLCQLNIRASMNSIKTAPAEPVAPATAPVAPESTPTSTAPNSTP